MTQLSFTYNSHSSPSRVAITGASGWLGSCLRNHLSNQGFSIISVFRKEMGQLSSRNDNRANDSTQNRNTYWNTTTSVDNLSPESLRVWEGLDSIIHLSGESLFGLWSPGKMKKIQQSRVHSTQYLVQLIKKLKHKPKTLIVANAVGYYGNRGSEKISETSGNGQGFLAKVGVAWEAAAIAASELGIRVVILQLGVVLGKGGGLPKMILPLRFGLCPIPGDGKQYISWVSINDVCSMVSFVLKTPTLEGRILAVSPHPLPYTDFMKLLNKQFNPLVRRFPTLLKWTELILPDWFIQFFLGDFGREMMLSSCRAYPEKLLAAGFKFENSDLESFITK